MSEQEAPQVPRVTPEMVDTAGAFVPAVVVPAATDDLTEAVPVSKQDWQPITTENQITTESQPGEPEK